jgi:nicotinamidase-related amidase
MPITALDQKIALIVIDLQEGILALAKVRPSDEIVTNAIRVIETFRAKGLPVVLVNVAGGAPGRNEQTPARGENPKDWSDLITELNQQSSDHLITKRSWGAFTNTDLLDYLRKNDVTQVALAGIATSIRIESTARQAHELEFNVTLIVNAMTDMNLDAHVNSVTRIFPRLGETCTASEIISLLNARG